MQIDPSRSHRLLAAVCIVVTACAAIADRRILLMPTHEHLRRVAIEGFARYLHGWRCVDSKASNNRYIPTAHIVDRTYVDSKGHQIQATLVTCLDSNDFHEAITCLPMQGYDIGPLRTAPLPGVRQNAYELTASKGPDTIQLLYWRPTMPSLAGGLMRNQWVRLQEAMSEVQGTDEQSLLVRFIMPASARNEQLMRQTAAEWEPDLERLTRAKLPPGR